MSVSPNSDEAIIEQSAQICLLASNWSYLTKEKRKKLLENMCALGSRRTHAYRARYGYLGHSISI
jgi:hypothetical protein